MEDMDVVKEDKRDSGMKTDGEEWIILCRGCLDAVAAVLHRKRGLSRVKLTKICIC